MCRKLTCTWKLKLACTCSTCRSDQPIGLIELEQFLHAASNIKKATVWYFLKHEKEIWFNAMGWCLRMKVVIISLRREYGAASDKENVGQLLLMTATGECLKSCLRILAHEWVRCVARCERRSRLFRLLPRTRRLKLQARVRLHKGSMSLVRICRGDTGDTGSRYCLD